MGAAAGLGSSNAATWVNFQLPSGWRCMMRNALPRWVAKKAF
jgi:hypothetical protein